MRGVFAALLLGLTNMALGQIVIPDTSDSVKHQIHTSMGLEPLWVTSVGYSQLLHSIENRTSIYLGGSIKFPPLTATLMNWRMNFTQTVKRDLWQKWKGIISNDIYLAHSKNSAGTMKGLGFDLKLAMLRDGGKWTKGLEAGWQHTFRTHIRHSAKVKDTFKERYALEGVKGPINGWYRSTASRFRFGFLGKRRIGKHMNIQLGIGTMVALQKQGLLLSFAHAQVPLYFSTQLDYQF